MSSKLCDIIPFIFFLDELGTRDFLQTADPPPCLEKQRGDLASLELFVVRGTKTAAKIMSFFKQAYLSTRRSFHVTVARNDSSALVWPWVTTATSSAGKIGDWIISQFQDNSITKFSDKPQHHFQSREFELKRLKELTQSLQKERNQKYPDTAVTVYVSGLPGIGKTQLVGDFARQTYNQKSFFKRRKSFIGTLDASNKESFQQSYEELANLITPGNPNYLSFGTVGSQGELQSLKILSNAVKKEMSKKSRKEWLLVVDGLSVSNSDKDNIMGKFCN